MPAFGAVYFQEDCTKDLWRYLWFLLAINKEVVAQEAYCKAEGHDGQGVYPQWLEVIHERQAGA